MSSSTSKVSIIGKRDNSAGEYKIKVNGEFEFFGSCLHLNERRQLADSLRSSVVAGNSLLGRFFTLIGLSQKAGSMADLNESFAKQFTPFDGSELSIYIWDEDDIQDHHLNILNSFFENWEEHRNKIRSDAYKVFNIMRDQVDKSSLENDFIYSSILQEDDIDDYFCISSVELNNKEVTKLRGRCLWDEEHGYEVDMLSL